MTVPRAFHLFALAAILGVAGSAVGNAVRSTSQSPSLPAPTAASTTTPSRSLPTPRPPVSPQPPSPLAAGPALTAALHEVWRDSPDGCLRVTAGDRVLYEANSDAPVVPASVTKLFTAAAALRALGPDARFRTTVRAASPPIDGVVAGDLWLVGGGDAVLGTDGWAAQLDTSRRLYTSLDALADEVVRVGVRRVDGRVLGDESRYDARRYVDTWPGRLIADGEAGPLSALTVNDGFRRWGHPGVPFTDPPAEAAAVFAELLTIRGVAVGRGAAAGVAPRESVTLADTESPPVGELVHAMLRDSDNGTAESLVKELGRWRFSKGSTAAGARAIRDVLTAAAFDGVNIADGSGLSDAARLTCRAVTTLLADAADTLPNRMALSGRDGTLARRFLGSPAAGRIVAKTGSLEGTAAIAGYAQSASGETLAFAYIINGLAHSASGRTLQDRLAVALVSAAP